MPSKCIGVVEDEDENEAKGRTFIEDVTASHSLWQVDRIPEGSAVCRGRRSPSSGGLRCAEVKAARNPF